MALEDYVTLGRSGLRVSPFCLGGMTFGNDWGWGASPATAEQMLSRYCDLGGNFIDTANYYTKGHSEAIIGDFIASGQVRRDRLVLASKFLCSLYAGDPNGGGAGRKALLAQCEQSLRRLRTDHIDLYWIHSWDRFTPIEETLRGLDDLVRSGKIGYVGFSDAPAWKIAQAQTMSDFRGWSRIAAIQVAYSLLERSVEGELMPMAQDLGLGVTSWGALAGGVLSGKYGSNLQSDRGGMNRTIGELELAVLTELLAIAQAHQASVPAVALAWLASRPGLTSVILGVRTVAQLDGNLAAFDLRLSAEEIDRLEHLTKPSLAFPAGFLETVPSLMHAGATVNGVTSSTYPFVPRLESERF